MTTSRRGTAVIACVAALLFAVTAGCTSSDKPKASAADESTTSLATATTAQPESNAESNATAAQADNNADSSADNNDADANRGAAAASLGGPSELAALSAAESECVQRFLGSANTTDFTKPSTADQLQTIMEQPDCASAFATLTKGDYSNAEWFKALNPAAQAWFRSAR